MEKYDELCNTLLALKRDAIKHDPVYLNAIAVKITEVLTDITGYYLHSLYNAKPDEETVKMMIDTVPSALSRKNDKGQLPIQTAVWHNDSVRYVPLLAKEGIKQKIGDRGGLLLKDPLSRSMLQHKSLCTSRNGENVLQLLAHLQNVNNPVPNDKDSLKAMIELRDSNLLFKQDIQEHNLLFWTCGPKSQLRFDFLADWYHEGLKECRYEGLPIIHAIISSASSSRIDRFATFLKTALKHHPNDLGLLFQMNVEGETALDGAINMYGKEATFKAIEECLPSDETELPVLHHVVQNAPQYQNDFAMRYASTGFLRDSKGRKLSQAELASGSKRFNNDATYFVKMTDEEVQEIDPGTGLYPFMVLASGQTSDLSAVYYLLRKNPSLVITTCSDTAHSTKRKGRGPQSKTQRGRKRNRK